MNQQYSNQTFASDSASEFQQVSSAAPAAISNTAAPTNVNRALCTEIPYAKEILRELEGSSATDTYAPHLEKLKQDVSQGSLCAAGYIILEARYLSLNDALKSFNPSGVLELGAGFLPRGLISSSEYSLYLETDVGPIISRKLPVVDTLHPNRNQNIHKLLELDMLNKNDMDRAGAIFKNAGINNLAVIHEGVFYYFDRDEQKQARDNIALFLERFSPSGTWITPDFPYSFDLDSECLAVRGEYERSAGKPWSTFTTDEDISAFLKEGGLNVELLDNSYLLGATSTERILGITNQDHVRKWLKQVRAAIVTLDK